MVPPGRRLYPHAARGEFFDLAAPGVEVVSTAHKGRFPVCSGTSFATAFVTGTAALVLEAQPGSPPGQMRDWMESSASDLAAAGRDGQSGAGLLDACAAAKRALGHPACR